MKALQSASNAGGDLSTDLSAYQPVLSKTQYESKSRPNNGAEWGNQMASKQGMFNGSQMDFLQSHVQQIYTHQDSGQLTSQGPGAGGKEAESAIAFKLDEKRGSVLTTGKFDREFDSVARPGNDRDTAPYHPNESELKQFVQNMNQLIKNNTGNSSSNLQDAQLNSSLGSAQNQPQQTGSNTKFNQSSKEQVLRQLQMHRDMLDQNQRA